LAAGREELRSRLDALVWQTIECAACCRGWKIPKWVAAAITLIALWGVFIAFFSLFIPLIFSKLNELSNISMSQLVGIFEEPLANFQRFLEHTFGVRGSEVSVTDSITAQIESFININAIANIVPWVISLLGNLMLALFSISFITFFFLREDHLFAEMVAAMFPAKYEQNAKNAIDSATNLLIRYFTGIVAESAALMLVYAIIFMLFGFGANTAFFIGFVIGVLNVIPFIGPIAAVSISILVGILTPAAGMTPGEMALIIGATFFCVNGLDNFVLQPILYSSRVKAHPLEIFIVILIAGSVAGILGMLLAIPAYNVLRVFAKEFFNNFKVVQALTRQI
ncbi:MAG: AI-2E family transporter, partial [Syntrophobacterales bacterium]|nr:AI-2E family transporter [Syntrophobacterales bacterium]